MTKINTNINSLVAQNALTVNSRAMSRVMNQLATGKRINGAADDAAGLAISEVMTAQIRGMNAATRNANDGISMMQTTDGAMIEITNNLQRMRELAVQASNGTLSPTQVGYLQTEFSTLQNQITSTINNTTWNGMSVLSSAVTTVTIQAGPDNGIAIGFTGVNATISAAAVTSSNLISAGTVNATNALTSIDTQLGNVASARASLGANINRLVSVANNMTNISQNLQESRSRVLDTDYAAATAELARTQIIQQAGTAVLAQANQLPQTVLALLR